MTLYESYICILFDFDIKIQIKKLLLFIPKIRTNIMPIEIFYLILLNICLANNKNLSYFIFYEIIEFLYHQYIILLFKKQAPQ